MINDSCLVLNKISILIVKNDELFSSKHAYSSIKLECIVQIVMLPFLSGRGKETSIGQPRKITWNRLAVWDGTSIIAASQYFAKYAHESERLRVNTDLWKKHADVPHILAQKTFFQRFINDLSYLTSSHISVNRLRSGFIR